MNDVIRTSNERLVTLISFAEACSKPWIAVDVVAALKELQERRVADAQTAELRRDLANARELIANAIGGTHETPACAVLQAAEELLDVLPVPNDYYGDEAQTLREALDNARKSSPETCVWRPIETAPKDGRTLLLGHFNKAGKWRTLRGQWYSRNQINEDWEEPENGHEGWYETSVENDDPPNCWQTEPTHWMPVPQPPTQKAEGGGT